jgi:hypothetical protein
MAIFYNRRYGNAMFSSVLIDTKTIVLRDLDSDSGNAFSIIRLSRTPFAFHSYILYLWLLLLLLRLIFSRRLSMTAT